MKSEGSSLESDRAIVDRKGAAMIKDLKKQLKLEQKRIAKLEEDLTLARTMSNGSQDAMNTIGTPSRSKGHMRSKSGASVRSMGIGESSLRHHGGSQESLASLRSTTSHVARTNTNSSNNTNTNTPDVSQSNEAPLISESEHVQVIQRLASMQTEKAELAEKVKFLTKKLEKTSVELETKTELVMQYATRGMSNEAPKENSGANMLGKRMSMSLGKKKQANNAMQDANTKMHVLLEETLMKNIQLQKMVEILQAEQNPESKTKTKTPPSSPLQEYTTSGSPNVEHELTTKM
eukprot:m.176813 g.176813  ORF g.176813 m.176813 type:complete len:291 (-) comp31859_c2_seq1:244-1116(-)